MTLDPRRLFNLEIWTPALEKYGGVARLTVTLFDATGQLACGSFHSTPLFDFFVSAPHDPGLIGDCVRRCLHATTRRPIVCAHASGLAVVGTSLVLNGDVVGVAVGSYYLTDFPQTIAVERLAKETRLEFSTLWEVLRQEAPVAEIRFSAQGELLQVLGDTILREMDRTRQYEEAAEQLRAAAEELRATAAAKDEFLAVLSHELRTPLTPILGWAGMLKLSDDPARIAHAADVIERNAQLQVRLVDDLLELTRVARGKVALEMTTVDLGEATRGAAEVYADAAKQQGVTLKVNDAERPLLTKADPFRLQQVLRNVLSNALKFTPRGGAVQIEVESRDERGVVTIRDSGEGIAPEFLPHVFDIFRQQEHGTRRTHDGLGIGLALVKRLTELQGGRVTVASAGPGLGTEISIGFPLSADSDEMPLTEPRSVVGVLRELNGLRILVVEDMEDTRETTRLILERLGADVLVACDGMEAIEMIDAAAPDLVLCDLRMPRMDGFEFMEALRDRPPDRCPPVIAVSGFVSRSDHVRTDRAGFVGHLDKPFDDAGLLAAVGAAIARRR
jgi:signal transduction histidine kinase/CheY-like chemotaxis protein